MALVQPPPLHRSLAIQARVVGALLMREILTRYGRRNIGFLWLFVEPMIFTLGILTLWTLWRSHNHGPHFDVVGFALTGYSSVLLWRNAANRCARAIEPNRSLLYHRNVAVIDLFITRLLLEIAGATISMLVLGTVFIFIGWMKMPWDITTMMFAWLMLCWFAISLGFIVGSITEQSEAFDRIWHTLTYLMFPLSGAIYMVDWLAKPLQEVVLWLPMVHGTEMLRGGYFGPMVKTHYDMSYMATCNLVMLLVGLLLLDKTKHLLGAE